MISNLGKSICFYYYGKDHLMINLYKYVKNFLRENSFVYFYMDMEYFSLIYENLEHTEKSMIGTTDISNVIIRQEEIQGLYIKESIKKLKDEKKQLGFSNIKIFIDASQLIRNTSQRMFTKFITISKELSNELNIDIIFTYDFEDYIETRKYINKDIMTMSILNHSFRLVTNGIKPMMELDTMINKIHV